MAEKTASSEPYLSTWLHSQGGAAGLPIGGNFELTPRCNFRCPMCYVHMNPEEAESVGKELTASQWIELAQKARDQGMMFALLTGGEPFIRKDFFEIYDAMKDMGIIISINSNGSLLDGEIRQRLLDNPPNRMNISLYGGCRETYRNMCGQDAFDKVVDNIRSLKAAGVDIRLNLSITPYNRQDIQRIFEISRELNVYVKGSSYMYPPIRVNGGQVGCGNRLTAEEAGRCSVEWDLLRFTPEQFAIRAKNMQDRIMLDEKECSADLDTGVSCRAGYSSFWMTWDGRMLPCGMMPSPVAYPLEIGFEAAWEQIRKQTRQIQLPAKCVGCDKKSLCAVCAAVCVTETGAFDKVPEYVCRQTEETIRATWDAYQERCGK